MALHHMFVIDLTDVAAANQALVGLCQIGDVALKTLVGDAYVDTHTVIGVPPGLDAHISQALFLAEVTYFRGTVDTSDGGYPGSYRTPSAFLSELGFSV